MWNIILWVLFGLIIGLIARNQMSKRHYTSLPMAILISIGGAISGGALSTLIFGNGFVSSYSGEDTTIPITILNLMSAVLGAIVLTSAFQIILNNREET